MPFGMKRAVRASRKLCEYLMIYTNERHSSLLHLTPIEIFQISMCQMSVDKRFILICFLPPPTIPSERGFRVMVGATKINIFLLITKNCI